MRTSSLLSLVTTITAAAAQQVAYGQCGGVGWTGPTSCVSGYYCSDLNAYYYQCIPGSASSSPSTTSTTTHSATTTLITTTTTTHSSTTASITTTTTTTSHSSSTTTTTPSSKISSSTTTSAASGGTSAISSYAKASGSVFEINGKETYFMGTNTYWLAFLTNNSDIDLVMSHIAETGLKVLRVWGFNDVATIPAAGTVWFQSFVTGESPTINTGADGLQRLDYVVQSAEAHGVSLIINFVNYWDNYGGQPLYVSYYDIAANDWYNTTAVQTQYQAYIEAVVSRYKTSTAIFAWELCNEPRCPGCDPSTLYNWVSTTSAYIKSLDPNHMVTLGDEGFGIYGGNDTVYPVSDTNYPWTLGPGYNWTTNLGISTIDFGTYHMYPQSWGESDTTWAEYWIQWHATAAAAVGKPCIGEEYGSTSQADEADWLPYFIDTQTAGMMYWQYGDTISTGQTANDGYTIYYGTSLFTTLVAEPAASMLAKAV